jgi:hypothetical protein
MSISIKNYVDVKSGVAGNAPTRDRQLILRLYTDNPLLPVGKVYTFTQASAVALFFGSSSAEYARAAFYFAYQSKTNTSPNAISFARWTSQNVAPTIYGAPSVFNMAQFTGITNGGLILTLGATTYTIASLNFTNDTTLAAVAARLQTAIRANVAGGALWTAATVTYDAVRQSFNFVGGATGVAEISVSAATSGQDVAGTLGWLVNPLLSKGAVAQTITQTLIASVDESNDFGSFAFIPTLTLTQTVEAATWNASNFVDYNCLVGITPANAVAWSAALIGFRDCCPILTSSVGEFHELMPAAAIAAIDYNKVNSTISFMYLPFNATPTVTTDGQAAFYDNLRINYYGQTQNAGQKVSFFQRGYMFGGNNDHTDINTHANEMWLKSQATTSILNLLLGLPKVSANAKGSAQIGSALNEVAQKALRNGTFSVGRKLTNLQKQTVTVLTGDENAWQDIESTGYVYTISFENVVVPNGATEVICVYSLIYAKDNTIRKVTGTHSAI